MGSCDVHTCDVFLGMPFGDKVHASGRGDEKEAAVKFMKTYDQLMNDRLPLHFSLYCVHHFRQLGRVQSGRSNIYEPFVSSF